MANKELLIRIAADSREAVSALQKIDKSAENTAKTAGKLDKAMGAALAAFSVNAVLDFGQEMFNLSATMEATERRASTVFGEMAGDAQKWAEENDEAFGVGTNALLGMQAAVGDLLVPMGFAREEALGMSQDILQNANALSQWTGGTIDAAAAQEKITKAILGERDGLVDLGIKISEADVQQRLAERGTKDLTGAALEQEKALITLALIQEKGADALTAYAEGAGEATIAQNKLNSEWANLKERTADDLGPALADVVGWLGSAVGAISDLNEAAGRANDKLVPWLANTEEVTEANKELTVELTEMSRRGRNAERMHLDIANAVTIVEQETKGYTRTIRDLITAQAEAADPALALINANIRLADAQDAAGEAAREHGADSDEARDAQLALLSAVGDLDGALGTFRQEGGAESIEALRAMAERAGLSEDAIARLIDQIKQLNATPVSKIVGGADGLYRDGKLIGFDTGGVVPGPRGKAQLAVVHGGETILPTHKGPVSVGSVGGGGGGGYAGPMQLVVNGRVFAEIVRDELTKLKQRSGPLGF